MDNDRIQELMNRAIDNLITGDEQEELDSYFRKNVTLENQLSK